MRRADRRPAPPLLTALPAVFSAARVMLATLTEPLVGQDTGVWWDRLAAGDFTATVFTQLLGGNGWPTVAPVLVLAPAAAALAIVAARKAGAAPSRESQALLGGRERGWAASDRGQRRAPVSRL